MTVTTDAMSGMIMHREDRLRPGVQPETWADEEVEIVDERNKNQAATNDAVSSTTANTTGNSAGDAATEKDVTMRRTGITDKVAFVLRTKRTPTRMTRPMISTRNPYGRWTPTIKNVTREHEAGYVLHAVAMEVAEEPERTQKDPGRPQDDLDCSCDDLAAATKEFSDCWAAHATGVKLCNAFRENCNRRANHEEIASKQKKALHRTFEIKRKAFEIQEG